MYNFFILYWYIITFSITILLTILSLKIKTSKRVYVIPWILLIIIYICYLFCNSDYNKLFIILSLLVISLFSIMIHLYVFLLVDLELNKLRESPNYGKSIVKLTGIIARKAKYFIPS